ncbi:hypothetical protein ABZV58_03690 [Nocardia sp. NPDC004654]|uniref:hypothetical protein n=1 Tax=Nocardia sp. NPDC004654 TaxID=3154776 RepID=UPI0033A690BC
MSDDLWRGIVNRIFYGVQFENELNQKLVDRIARALLTEPIGTLTPDQEYEALAGGLRSNTPLPTLVQMRQNGAELRDFLIRIVLRMDELRPWSEPPFQLLPESRLSEFGDAHPIARIRISIPDAEARILRHFYHDPENGDYLLLRMRSGAVIGLFSPFWDGSDDIVVVSESSGLSPHVVIDELLDATDLRPDLITFLTEEDLAPEQPRTAYETTPIQPQFQGENLPGNQVWSGKQVRYLSFEERQSFRLTARNGLLHDSRGRLSDTTAAQTLWTPNGGRAIFVMDSEGTIYSAPFHILGEFHHSSFLAGAPAAGAGEIAIVQGRVQLISDQSSHYRPARRFTLQVVDSLRRQGLAVGVDMVEFHAPPDRPSQLLS